MTLEALAERSGLTPNFIGAIERGERDPSLATMTVLAQALDTPLGGLFEGVPELGPLGLEVATLFDGAPERVREGILMVLRHTATIK
jgi:transcriptional regulator with XRE-family HTH domain